MEKYSVNLTLEGDEYDLDALLKFLTLKSGFKLKDAQIVNKGEVEEKNA